MNLQKKISETSSVSDISSLHSFEERYIMSCNSYFSIVDDKSQVFATPILGKNYEFQGDAEELNKIYLFKKFSSALLSDSYKRLEYYKQSDKVSLCMDTVTLKHAIVDGKIEERGTFHQIFFCKDRLCPTCNTRRSLKIFGQLSRVMDKIYKDYKFLFLTLTVPNVKADKLEQTVNDLNYGFNKGLMRNSKFKKAVKGYFRTTEITYNRERDDFHPHIHCLLAVDKDYFDCRYSSSDYLSRDFLLDIWRKAMKDDRITQIDIRAVKNKNGSEVQTADDMKAAVLEVSKYSVKSKDFIYPDEKLTDKVVSGLYPLFHNHKRLCYSGGIIKETLKNLNFDDMENGDLNIVDPIENPCLSWIINKYKWKIGFGFEFQNTVYYSK